LALWLRSDLIGLMGSSDWSRSRSANVSLFPRQLSLLMFSQPLALRDAALIQPCTDLYQGHHRRRWL